jgi:hypothetical protein
MMRRLALLVASPGYTMALCAATARVVHWILGPKSSLLYSMLAAVCETLVAHICAMRVAIVILGTT